MRKCSLYLPFSVLVALAALVGCKSGNPNSPSSVSGKVSYKNEPVKGGTITFITKEGISFLRPIGTDGSYNSTDMPVGDYTVVVETESLNPDKKVPAYGGGRGGAGGGMSPAPQGRESAGGSYVKIPTKYSDKKSTSLKATLTKGVNTKDFDLTD
jgi:hypothetical protein